MDMQIAPMQETHVKLLKIAARVAKSVTSVLDLDLLLRRTVEIVCDEFHLCHVGVFLLDETGKLATLRAGRNVNGADVVNGAASFDELRTVSLSDDSLISAAIKQRESQITLDVDADRISLVLPETRAVMVLPLDTGGEVIGAMVVQSESQEGFDEADTITLHIIADQLALAIKRSDLYRQIQELLHQSVRRARLLIAANAVGHSVATIFDLDELLPKTVDTICQTYGFYYAGVFLLDEEGRWAVLRAGRGEAGEAMIAAGHRLEVGGNSMVSAAIQRRQARIALDVGEEATFRRNPYLPETRSEMALPLSVGNKALGAVTVQSTEERAFGEDDVMTLQTMADYLAIAIHNAQVLQELERANAELVRTKTYEAIATATGEAIHWVGNKAAPITGSVERVSEDLTSFLIMANALLAEAPAELREHKYAGLLAEAAQTVAEQGVNVEKVEARLARTPARRLRRMLSAESIFEDLKIIQTGANSILNIKEDLMGPARKRTVGLIDMPALLKEVVASMGIPAKVARLSFEEDLPPVKADRTQMDRVFVNLVKNAMEAMEGVKNKRLLISAGRSAEPGMVEVKIADSGVGIPPDQIDKIWVAFYTTKGDRGGTGLGLPACLEIVQQSGGKIRVDSEVGKGTTFTILLPAAATGKAG